MKILTEPKNAITKQYEKMFEIEGCEIEFRADSLTAVAKKAMERKTGARGLRTILENTLLEIMYDLPAMENVSKVVVDAAVIEGHAQPYVIYEGGDMQRVASDE